MQSSVATMHVVIDNKEFDTRKVNLRKNMIMPIFIGY